MCNLGSAQLQIKLYKTFPDCTSKEVWKSAAPSAITFHVHLNLTAKLFEKKNKNARKLRAPVYFCGLFVLHFSPFSPHFKVWGKKLTCFSYWVLWNSNKTIEIKKESFLLQFIRGATDHKSHALDWVTVLEAFRRCSYIFCHCNSVKGSPLLLRKA